MPKRLLLLLCALAALLSACKVDTTVDVTVREDGSGVVRVNVTADAEAVQAAESGGVPLEDAVRLDDLAEAGFDVGSWRRAEGGSATIVIARPFASVDEVAGIVEALGGPDGPLPQLDATLEKGIYATDYAVEGRIDLDSVTTGVGDDEELVARLQALGIDVNVVDQQLLAQVQSSFGLEVVVRLPDQPAVTFTPKEGATTAAVDASAQVLNLERIIFAGAALGFLLLAIIVWRRGGKRRRRRRRRAPTPTPEPTEQASPRRRPPARGAGPPRDAPPRRPAPGTAPHPPGPRAGDPRPGDPRRGGSRPPGPRQPRPPGPSGPAPGPPRHRGGGPPRRPPSRP